MLHREIERQKEQKYKAKHKNEKTKWNPVAYQLHSSTRKSRDQNPKSSLST